jgi:Polysaccharide biosynthesis/export protein
MRKRWLLPLPVLMSLAVPPVSQTIDGSQTAKPQAGQKPAEYHIGPGDPLLITVYGQPDFSSRQIVSSDGTIRLPKLTEIKVAGLKSRELEQLLEEKLKPYVEDPQVTVVVQEGKFSIIHSSRTEHPERIPDLWVYQGWYDTVSRMTSEDQPAFLRSTGVDIVDQEQLHKALASYNVRKNQIDATFKASVEAGGAKLAADKVAMVDLCGEVHKSLVDLVDQTNKDIQSLLSPAGWIQFQAFMKESKANMQVGPGLAD